MFLVCPDPYNYDGDWKKEIISCQSEDTAIREARKLAHYCGKAMIYRLDSFHLPVGESPTTAYIVNAKGEILPKV